MSMAFEELDDVTRRYMLEAFEEEEATQPYRSLILSPGGLDAFPDHLRRAIQYGDETTLADSLKRVDYWLTKDAGGKTVNVAHRSAQLALSEFNTWYVAGLSRRLGDEGETQIEVYRAADPKWEPSGCSSHEGQVYSLDNIIAGHRAGYWPPPGDPTRLSIPSGPGCHHTIRRLRA